MTVTERLKGIRERVEALDGINRADISFQMAAHYALDTLTQEDLPKLLDAVEAVMREVEYAPESNDYLEDRERGHRAALIEIGRVVSTALEGK